MVEINLNCQTCWSLRLEDCPDSLVFPLGLSASTEYDWKVQDAQGNIYTGTDTTNGSGTLTISTSEDPFDSYPGLFSQYAGSFRLTVLDGSGNPVEFTVLGTEYTCVSFSFKETVENDVCEDSPTCICSLAGWDVPSDLIGENGDLYFRADGNIYRKLYNTWSVWQTVGGGGGGMTSLTGDVTGAGSGAVATTIANDAVTFAKMQNISTDKLLGRDTAGSGNVEEIGLNATLEFDGSGNVRRAALTGDVASAAGSNATTLANSGVTAGSYTNTSMTVDAKGRVTAASSGTVAVTGAANGNTLVSGNVEQGGTLTKDTTIEAAAFKWLLKTQIDADQTVGLEKWQDGGQNYVGHLAESTKSNLLAFVRSIIDLSTGELRGELLVKDLVGNVQSGVTVKDTGIEGYTRGDLLLTVNTVVGTFQVSETVTADNGATGVIHSVSVPTKKRILPVSGDWLTVSDITGNTSGATANVSNVVPQKWTYADHNANLWLVYDEYEGYIIIGHDSADRPNVGVLIQNEVYFLDYPETRDDTGTIPQTNVLYTGPNGEVCSAPFSGGNTIYTGDGTLLGNRTIDAGGFNLNIYEQVAINQNAGWSLVTASNIITSAHVANKTATYYAKNAVRHHNAGNTIDASLGITDATANKSRQVFVDEQRILITLIGVAGEHLEMQNSNGDAYFNFDNDTDLFTLGFDDSVTRERGGKRIGITNVNASGTYSVLDTDYVVVVNPAVAGASTMELPAAPATGQTYIFKDDKGDAAANNITIDGNGNNIDGAATLVINANKGKARVVFNGTQWNEI